MGNYLCAENKHAVRTHAQMRIQRVLYIFDWTHSVKAEEIEKYLKWYDSVMLVIGLPCFRAEML